MLKLLNIIHKIGFFHCFLKCDIMRNLAYRGMVNELTINLCKMLRSDLFSCKLLFGKEKLYNSTFKIWYFPIFLHIALLLKEINTV